MSYADHRSVPETFVSGGTRISAVVYETRAEPAEPAPAVLICAGFSGTQDTPSVVAVAEEFATHGWAAMTFDYRSFGQSEGEPRQVVSVPRQLEDIRAALAHLRARPDINPGRVALWGSSLGGGHVIAIAAEDPTVAAVIAQVPFNGFPKEIQSDVRSRSEAYALLWTAVRDRMRGWTGRPPLYLKAVGNANENAIMVGRDANRTIEVLTSATWRNQVAPRGILDMLTYRPGRNARSITAPLLVCIGEYDRETQGTTAEPIVRDAPRGELRSYPFAHFDIYRPEIRERVLADQVDFLSNSLNDDT